MNNRKIRILRAILKMVEDCLNRATNPDDYEKWKEQHQKLVTKISKLKKEPEPS